MQLGRSDEGQGLFPRPSAFYRFDVPGGTWNWEGVWAAGCVGLGRREEPNPEPAMPLAQKRLQVSATDSMSQVGHGIGRVFEPRQVDLQTG